MIDEDDVRDWVIGELELAMFESNTELFKMVKAREAVGEDLEPSESKGGDSLFSDSSDE